MMQRAVILFGSNLGDREAEIRSALQSLENSLGKAEKISALYETQSWGIDGQPDYLNCVAGFLTAKKPEEILRILLDTEVQAGRVRNNERYASRTIDLDLLLYGDQVIHVPGLQVPHPRMTARRFTMIPLAEIYPEILHPQSQRTLQDLLDHCADPCAVKLYSDF